MMHGAADTIRRLLSSARLAGVLVVALGGCAQNPVTGGQDFVLMSENQELSLGRKTHTQILEQFGEYDDPQLQAYVRKVGKPLGQASHRASLIYRFTVLDSTDINAFALPGGYIYVTRGMLAYLNSEAELAAVLGHEIGHVTARHSVRQYTAQQAAGIGAIVGAVLFPQMRTAGAQDAVGLLGNALLSGYGREHELEADRLGAEYLARTGYDPEAMLGVLRILKQQEIVEEKRAAAEDRRARTYHGVFSTHPDNDTRLKETVLASRDLLDESSMRRVGRDSLLDAIDGMAYGPSAREGVLRGRNFYHSGLDLGLKFPRGWRIDNLPDRLVAHSGDNQAVLQITTQDLNRKLSPEGFARERLKLDLVAGKSLQTTGGLPAFTGVTRTQTPFGTRETRFTIVHHLDRAYVFAGASRDKSREEFDSAFLSTALSLHTLTDEERELAQEQALRVVAVDKPTTFAALARRSSITNYAEDQLRLINGQYPAGQPAVGTRIKLVE